METIDQIKKLYGELWNKTQFHEVVAFQFDLSPSTIRTHWFQLKNIPEKYHSKLIKLLNHVIELQKEFDEKYYKLLKSKI